MAPNLLAMLMAGNAAKDLNRNKRNLFMIMGAMVPSSNFKDVLLPVTLAQKDVANVKKEKAEKQVTVMSKEVIKAEQKINLSNAEIKALKNIINSGKTEIESLNNTINLENSEIESLNNRLEECPKIKKNDTANLETLKDYFSNDLGVFLNETSKISNTDNLQKFLDIMADHIISQIFAFPERIQLTSNFFKDESPVPPSPSSNGKKNKDRKSTRSKKTE